VTRAGLFALVLVAAAPAAAKQAAWSPSTEAEKKGWDIAKNVEKANNGFVGEDAETEMVLFNAHGDQVVRRMTTKTRETPRDGDKAVSEFLWPADVKGTRMLTWTHKKKDDDQWLYLPAIKRVKRISSRNKSGAFMGSEFAYEDLGSQEPEKFTHKFLEETVFDERKVWLLEQVPLYRSGYSREKIWMDQKYLNPVKIEYYDRKGELLKTARFTGYRRYGQFWRMGQIEMTNHQTRKRSIVRWKKRALGRDLDPEDFESENLAD